MSTTYTAPNVEEMEARAHNSLGRKGTRQTELNLAGDVLALAATAKALLDTVIWMSGSPSFGPEGEAGEKWAQARDEIVAPALKLLARDEPWPSHPPLRGVNE